MTEQNLLDVQPNVSSDNTAQNVSTSAGVIFDSISTTDTAVSVANSTIKLNEIQEFSCRQYRENIPPELANDARWIPVGVNKVPTISKWTDPDNQKKLAEVEGLAGCVINGYGTRTAYFCFDFDHYVIGDKLEEKFMMMIPAFWRLVPRCYVETSLSGQGMHIIVKPSDDFAKTLSAMSGGKNGILYLSTERGKYNPRLECYWESKGKQIILTGNVDDDLKINGEIPPILEGNDADNLIKFALTMIQKQNSGLPFDAEETANAIEDGTFEFVTVPDAQGTPEEVQTQDTATIKTPDFSQSARVTSKIDLTQFNDSDTPEYDSARALVMLNCIDISKLNDKEWLAVMSACKNIGIPYSTVDAKNAQDSARYNATENAKRWDSLVDPRYNILTLHGIAKRFGYDEHTVWHEWHNEKFYTQWLMDNKISDVVKSNRNNKNDFTNSDTSILSARVGQVNERTDIFMSTDTTVTNATVNSDHALTTRKDEMSNSETDHALTTRKSKKSNIKYYTAREVAKILGVSEWAVRDWRQKNIFGEDVLDHHGVYWYSAERVEQLKSVYHKGWEKIYKNNVRDMSADNDTNSQSTPDAISQISKDTLFGLPHTDRCNAERLVACYRDRIRFLTDSHKWLVYDDKKNVWKDEGKENSAILPFTFAVSKTISAFADDLNPIDEKLDKSWQKRKTQTNAIELAKGINKIRITEEDLNRHKNLLNCKNGVIDLETGKLYPHNYKLLLTQCVNAEYRAGYHHERLDRFLREVLPDEETLLALLRFFGYCLTGEVSEHKALFIHGRGGNGKSVLTKTLLKLFGDYGCGFPIEAILAQSFTKDADAATPAFNKLQFRRMAIAEEIPSGRKLDSSKFKILTGGDSLPIRKLHQEATEIKDPVHKMIFSGNNLPEPNDAHDIGLLRRWLQIKFAQDFTQNPDTTLPKILQSDDALSALLNLLVGQAVRYYKDGLFIPEKLERAKNNYFAVNDFISEFISECCERVDSGVISRKDFLDRLRWEYPHETKNKTNQELTLATAKLDGIHYKRGGTNGGYKFFGIRLLKSD